MPECTTPELRPDWCSARSGSFSKTVTSQPRRASSRATASPTSPAPTTPTRVTSPRVGTPPRDALAPPAADSLAFGLRSYGRGGGGMGGTRSWWGWGTVEDAVRGAEREALLARVAAAMPAADLTRHEPPEVAPPD